jgi:hypothetical protein
MVVKCLGLFVGIILGLYLAYWLKVRLNINLNVVGNEHFPSFIERKSHGLVKCRWFPNSHHCK